MTVATTSPGYASTVRVGTPPKIGATADLASAIMAAGGSLTALDVVKSNPSSVGVETMVIVPFGGDTTANNSMIAETRRLPLGGHGVADRGLASSHHLRKSEECASGRSHAECRCRRATSDASPPCWKDGLKSSRTLLAMLRLPATSNARRASATG